MDIETKLDKIIEDIGKINVTLAAQHVVLEEHVRRSNLLEEDISLLKKRFSPIESHVLMVNAVVKILGSITILIGLLASLTEIIIFFKH